MVAGHHRRSIILSIPAEKMEVYYAALNQLQARLPQFSRSAIIVHLVLDPTGNDVLTAYREQYGSLDTTLSQTPAFAQDDHRPTLGISIPRAVRDAFFAALGSLVESSHHSNRSAVIIDIVIAAADAVEQLVFTHHATTRPSDTMTQYETRDAFIAEHDPLLSAPIDVHRVPSIFHHLFYSGYAGRESHLRVWITQVTQMLDQFPVQSLGDMWLRAVNRQLLGVLVQDSGDLEGAQTLFSQALADAQAIQRDQPDEAINLIAAVGYRQSALYRHMYKKLPSSERVQRDALLAATDRALTTALDAIEHPGCRSAVRGVILLWRAMILAQVNLYPNLAFEEIRTLLYEALELARTEVARGGDGYDPVGFMLHPAGVWHMWAQITLDLAATYGDKVQDAFTIDDGIHYMQTALNSDLAALPRWRQTFQMTAANLLLAQSRVTFNASLEKIQATLPEIRASASARLKLDMRRTLDELFAHQSYVQQRTRSLYRDVEL
jgi:hypothetical protein